MPSLKFRQSSDRQNHGDVEIPSDPNAMGKTMRAPYDATASAATGLADMHDTDMAAPYPRRNNGFIGVHGKRSTDDRRSGPAGKFDSYVK